MTNLHVNEYGASTAPAVVLLSSIATTHEAWAKQIPALAENFRVITVDHRGHGRSETARVAPGATTMDTLAADVLHALDEVGVNRFRVVGLSLGGALAQHLAAKSGRVEKAVFACTATYLGGPEKWRERTETARTQGMDALADGMMENWFTEGFRASHPDEVRHIHDMVAGIDGEAYAQNGDALAGWDFADQLGEVTCPVLTIAGAQDPSTTPAELARIAERVAGPVESVVIDPGSHQVAIERPEEFNRALTQFL